MGRNIRTDIVYYSRDEFGNFHPNFITIILEFIFISAIIHTTCLSFVLKFNVKQVVCKF